MENYSYYSEPINTTLTIRTALFLGLFVTLTTAFGISHGKHMDKTASKVDSYSVPAMLKISRRENNLS